VDARRQAADPLWFLRQPGGTAAQDGTPTQATQTPPEAGVRSLDAEIKLSRPQDLRATLPPLFGAEDQAPALARMPAPETQPNPPPTPAPGKTAGATLDNIHTAKTQPLMPAPDMADDSRDDAGTPEPEAAAPAVAASAERSAEPSRTVEAKLDDSFQPQAQAASMAMPATPAEPAGVKPTSPGAGLQARGLEQVIGELLEPVIRQWLEANLPRLVEDVVRKEVARAIAVERPTSAV
jgi:cell pole-organizing protein PopZ